MDMEKMITQDMTINRIIKDFPGTIGLFKDVGIDSCCGGELSLREATLRHEIPLEDILDKLNKQVKK